MGLLLRGIRWIWNRIGDAYTVADLADLFDLKTAGIAILGFLGMLIFGSANYEWSPQTILLAALIAGACVAIIVIALRFVVGAFHAPASTAKKNQKNQSRRELAARLDREFFSEGVRERNRVQNGKPIIDAAEYQQERVKFAEWSNLVQSVLDESEYITVKEQSNFRTLYNLEPDNRIPKLGPYQTHLIKMWNRKLDMLRSIIDRIGGS